MNQVSVLLLAAGFSRRFDSSKIWQPWGEVTVLESCLHQLLQSECQQIVLIIASSDLPRVQVIQSALKTPRLHVVCNESPQEGMLASIQCGWRALHLQSNIKQSDIKQTAQGGVMIALADQPHINTATYNILISAFVDDCIVVPFYGQQKGNPVILPDKFRQEVLMQAPIDTGCRFLLKKYPEFCKPVPMQGPEVLLDIDTREDYEKLRHKYATQ